MQQRLKLNNKVEQVRGLGLMQGVALHEPVAPYLKRLYSEHKVACISASPNTLRLVPPLTIKKEQLQMAVNAIVAVLS